MNSGIERSLFTLSTWRPWMDMKRGAAGWFWGLTAPLAYQAAIAFAETGTWSEAVWPRMVWVLALVGGAAFSVRGRLAERFSRPATRAGAGPPPR